MASRFTGNGLLRLEIENLAPRIGHIARNVHSLNAAVHAPGKPPLAQERQIPADGLGGHPEVTGKVIHTDHILLADHFGNLSLAF